MNNLTSNIEHPKSKHTPLVSVIITTRNEEKNIKNILDSILFQTYKNIEIIVVDNNSIDKTKKVVSSIIAKNSSPVIASKAKQSQIYFYNKGPERSAQRNFGAKKAHGEYVLFLDADMLLTQKVISSCVNLAESYQVLDAVIIPEKSFGEGFWAQCKALERSFYVGVDWMEAARFYRKEVFEKLGGYDVDQTGTEDFDLPQRLKAKYGGKSIGRVKEYILHNEGRLSLLGTMKKKYYYAKTLDKYNKIDSNKKLFTKQSGLLDRYILYFSKPQELISHPIVGIGMLVMKTMEFMSGGLGYILSSI